MSRCLALIARLVLILAVGIGALTAVVVALRYTLLAFLVAAAVCWRRLGRWRGSTSHGSARVCSLAEMDRAGMLANDDGLILGRVGGPASPSRLEAIRALLSPSVPSDRACGMFLSAFYRSRWMADRIIRVRDYVHLATFSRTGGGKGVSCVLPNLLSYSGSVVVIDPKCENYLITAAFRGDRMGHKIVRLDPLLLGGLGAASFNPLAFIHASAPDFLDHCRDLANMLVVRQGTEPEPFWNDATELVLTAFICFVCACEPDPAERNLQTVRMLVSSRETFNRSLEIMRQSPNEVVRRLGGQLTWFVDRELGSVLTSVQRHTSWMDSPAVAACMTANDFDPRELRTGIVSVFLVLPPERLVTWAPLMRMWVGSFLRIIIREGASERNRILFMLDEIAQLGRMQALEDAVSIVRGYGICLWFIFQSLKQVQDCYGTKAGVILDNIPTMQFFALGNALETAEMCSRRIGDETIRITTPSGGVTFGSSTSPGQMGPSSSHSANYGTNTNQLPRKVFFPDEILRLPEDTALIFHKNMPVIMARLLRYYNAPEFRRGRMGKQRGLGPVAAFQAALALAASLVLAAVVVRPGTPGFQPVPRAGYVAAPWQPGRAMQPWYVVQPPGQQAQPLPPWYVVQPPGVEPLAKVPGVEPLAKPLPSASGGGFPPRRAFTPAGASGRPVIQPPGVEPSAKPLPSASGGQSPSTPSFMPAGRSGEALNWNPATERGVLWPVNRRDRNR